MAVYATIVPGRRVRVQQIGALLAGGIAQAMGAPLTLGSFLGSLCMVGAGFCCQVVMMRMGGGNPALRQRRRAGSGVMAAR